MGKYWVWTVPELRALVALDVSNPAKPREVSRLVFGGDMEPHWMAKDASGTRLVVNTGGHGGDSRMYLVRINPKTGALSKDPKTPVLEMGTVEVPGIGDVVAKPHGAVFAN